MQSRIPHHIFGCLRLVGLGVCNSKSCLVFLRRPFSYTNNLPYFLVPYFLPHCSAACTSLWQLDPSFFWWIVPSLPLVAEGAMTTSSIFLLVFFNILNLSFVLALCEPIVVLQVWGSDDFRNKSHLNLLHHISAEEPFIDEIYCRPPTPPPLQIAHK